MLQRPWHLQPQVSLHGGCLLRNTRNYLPCSLSQSAIDSPRQVPVELGNAGRNLCDTHGQAIYGAALTCDQQLPSDWPLGAMTGPAQPSQRASVSLATTPINICSCHVLPALAHLATAADEVGVQSEFCGGTTGAAASVAGARSRRTGPGHGS